MSTTVIMDCYRIAEVRSNLTRDDMWLTRRIDMDGPFTVTTCHVVTDWHEGLHAPEACWSEDGGLEVLSDEWEAWSTGMCNQWGYTGPIMHPSEYLGGGMAQTLLDEPGTYVITEVVDLDDPDAPVGWIMLKRKEA